MNNVIPILISKMFFFYLFNVSKIDAKIVFSLRKFCKDKIRLSFQKWILSKGYLFWPRERRKLIENVLNTFRK